MDQLLVILAVWRLSSLFVHEDGPLEIFARLRDKIGVRYDEQSRPYGSNELAKVFTCVWCVSVWIGLLWALVFYPGNFLIGGLAYSAGAILIERAVYGSR